MPRLTLDETKQIYNRICSHYDCIVTAYEESQSDTEKSYYGAMYEDAKKTVIMMERMIDHMQADYEAPQSYIAV